MITAEGYSKDLSLIPEGIVVTFGREMMFEQGGPKQFLGYFLECMADEDSWWMHYLSKKPTKEVGTVYIIALNRLYGKVNFGWYEVGETTGGTADGDEKVIDKPRVCLVGPFIRCPFKRKLNGFQGFRYATKLF